MKKKIRFLATGDFHSDKKLISNIQKYNNFNEIDFVIFTGDLTEKKNDFKHLLSVFNGKQIFMVPGNHETKKHLSLLKKHYNVHLVGNSPVLINDDLALFGTNYINIGPYGIDEHSIFENLVENFNTVKDVKNKILLSHIPPIGTQIGDASPLFPMISGSMPIRMFLEHFDPGIALVGHIHETSGLEEIVNKTKVVNVGRTSKLFEFDTEKAELNIIN